MTPEELDYSARLMKATDDFLGTLKPNQIKGAINWGDLGCSLVERVESYGGSPATELAWRVVIEEAAPGSYELTSAVHNELSAQGFKNIEVQAEW